MRIVLQICHAANVRPVKEQSRRQRVCLHRQVGTAQGGFQKGAGRAAALTVFLRELIESEALLRRAIEVLVARKAKLHRGVEEGTGEWIDVARVRDIERAADTVKSRSAALLMLRFFEI